MNNKNEFKPENGDIHKARGKKSINCKKGFKRLFARRGFYSLVFSGFSAVLHQETCGFQGQRFSRGRANAVYAD